jgi:hypothetical protein
MSHKISVFFALLLGSSATWATSNADLISDCGTSPQADMHACIAKQAVATKKLYAAAKTSVTDRLKNWVASDDQIKAAQASFIASEQAFQSFKRQQCEAYSSTAGGAAGNAHDDLLLACQNSLDNQISSQWVVAFATLPQKSSWLKKSGSLDEYVEPILNGEALPACEARAGNKMHPDLVLMDCFESTLQESNAAASAATKSLFSAFKGWDEDADRKELSSALFKVAKPAYSDFVTKQAAFLSSLAIEDTGRAAKMVTIAIQVSWGSTYVVQLKESAGRIGG